MSLIEGIGDEVLICAVLTGLIGLIVFAWATTRVRPLFNSSSVWMVHMQTSPERRVLEVYSLDDNSAVAPQLDPALDQSDAIQLSPGVAESLSSAQGNTNLSAIEDTNYTVDVVQTQMRGNDSEDQAVGPSEGSASSIPAVTPTSKDDVAREMEPSSGQGGTSQEPESCADTATIKLKFLDDTQRLVAAWLPQTVGEFKRQHFEPDVSQGKVVRLIYRGQLLRDDSRSLASYGLHENCVVHCHVSTTPYDQQSATGPHGGDVRQGTNAGATRDSSATFDLGGYIYFIFAFKFAALWSAWFIFPEYFNRTSLVSLILCSGLFMLFWYGSQRRRRASVGSNRFAS